MTLLLLAVALLQDGLGQTPLAEAPVRLLNGRLSARFPAGAVVEARSRGLMAAPEADERETRVVWNDGPRRLVTMVYEQLETAGDDLVKDVAAVVKTWEPRPDGFAAAAFALPDAALRGCAVTPKQPDPEREAVFVFGLFVAGKDRAVQFLAVYANPEAAKDLPGCAALGRRIGASLAPGGRALQLAAGRRTLHEVEGRRVTVEMPEGYVLTFQKGPDFRVTSVVKLVPLGSPRPLVGVYLGGHPRYHHERADPPVQVAEEAAEFLGRPVQWQRWTQKGEEGETHFAELILPLPESREHLLHVFASAESADGLKSLRAALATMKIEPAK